MLETINFNGLTPEKEDTALFPSNFFYGKNFCQLQFSNKKNAQC